MKKNTEPSEAQAQTAAASPQPETAAPAGEPAETQSDEQDKLREQLAQREEALQQAGDALLRARAELQNVQRTAQRDIANAHKYGSETLVAAMLPGLDSLDQALASPENTTTEALRQGVRMTLDHLERALTRAGVKTSSPLGEDFDPGQHLASAVRPADDAVVGQQKVLEVLQRGWIINGRVLRPAAVVISAPVADAATNEEKRETGGEEK